MTPRRAQLLAAAAAVLAFSPALFNGFVNFDDTDAFVDNPMIRALGWENLKWLATTTHLAFYKPLAWLSTSLLYAAFGPAPWAFHAAGLLLHAACAAALAALALELLAPGRKPSRRELWAAAAAAALWAVHPLQAAAACWATRYTEVLAALLCLHAARLYLRGSVKTAAALHAASGLVSWIGVALPVALAALDWLRGPRRPLKRRALDLAPFFAVSAAVAIGSAKAKSAIAGIQLGYALAHPGEASLGLLFYLAKALAPFGLIPIHRVNAEPNPVGLPPGLALALVLALCAAAAALAKRRPAILAAWAFYLAAVFPTLAASAGGTIFAQDVYAYLPGAAAALLWAGFLAWDWSPGPAARAGLAALVLGLAALSFRQARVWKDSITLWRHALSVDAGFWLSHQNLAAALAEAGRLSEAKPHWRAVLRLKPMGEAERAELSTAVARLPD